MRIFLSIVLLLSAVDSTFADQMPESYADAKAIWAKTRNTADYQKYAKEFTQFNNSFRLDEKGGCYSAAPGPVNLMLVISYQEKSEFAVIDRVFVDVDNAKARCFQKSYRGIRTKIPPFRPLVLQLNMG